MPSPTLLHAHPLIIIAAVSNDHVIGNEAGMPWQVEEEYEQYLEFVSGNTVIMGRKTFEIFGPDLQKTRNLIISRSSKIAGNLTFDSLSKAISEAHHHPDQIFIAGGSSIYEQALPIANKMYLSFIKGKYLGDRYFPQFSNEDWLLYHEKEHQEFTFRKYQRISLLPLT